MKWKLLLAAGAVVGGVVWAAWQKTRKAEEDAELWAEATDPVTSTA